MAKILITGGSGLVGSALTKLLLENNYDVVHLSRSSDGGKVRSFRWSYEKGEIENDTFDGVDYIVNLAGANLSARKWSRERKSEIKNSRTKTTQLIYSAIKDSPDKPKAIISASAIGYYGYDSGSIEKREGSRFGDDFIATVVKEWEAEADKFIDIGMRVVKLRMGIVLSEKGGALEKIAKPVKLGFGAPLGRGDQYISWIHIDDICGIILKSIEDENMNDVYNAVSPSPVTNKEFTKAVAVILKKPFFLPNVPPFVLKILLGEMASMVLGGNNVSSEKLQATGYEFQYSTIEDALQNLL